MSNIDEENFSEYMREALYGEEGFYTTGRGSGRTRDFMTSPEVGDLFGTILSRYIDQWYESIAGDEPGIIIDAGCGPGSLGASIARAGLAYADSLEYRLVEISPVHREEATRKMESAHPDFEWSVHETLPECNRPTLVVANELLDNLVFDICRTGDIYKEYEPDRKNVHEAMAYIGIFGNIDLLSDANVPRDIGDFRVPFHVGIGEWIDELSVATSSVASLSIIIFDYMKPVVDMADENWLRMYADNLRIVGVDEVLRTLESGVSGDITTDIIREDLYLVLERAGYSNIEIVTQTQWLLNQSIDLYCRDITTVPGGYDQLVQFVEGNATPTRIQSFSVERNILTDENGLGGFSVVTASRFV